MSSLLARRIAGSLLVVAMALGGTPADAQESPDRLTRDEARCQGTTAAALGRFAEDAAACLGKCRAKAAADPTRRCDPFGGPVDLETASCLTIARARATIETLGDCTGTECPECYARANCVDFTEGLRDRAEGFLRGMNASIFCSDGGVDGLTPPEAACQQAAFKGVGKLFTSISRCLGRCQRATEGSATGCFLDDAGTVPQDDRTARCVERARQQFLRGCGRRCADQPECGFTNCESLYRATVEQFRTPFGGVGDMVCVDRTACGDGFVSGDEHCDIGLFPTGCGGNTPFCNLACQCEPQRECGDGRVSGGESCDHTATPTGCPAGDVCVFGCSFCTSPFCGDGFVIEPESCDPSSSEPSRCAANEICTSGCQCFEVIDACAEVQDVPPAGGILTGVTAGFSSQDGSCGLGPSPERAYRWVPETSGTANVDACSPGNFFHTIVYVRQDTCTGPEVTCAQHSATAACDDNHGGRAVFSATAGTAYYLFIDGWSGEQGAYTVSVVPPAGSPSGAFVDTPLTR